MARPRDAAPVHRTTKSGLGWFRQGGGDPVLLIHGTGVGARAWEPQVEALAPQHRCLTFDHRGLGVSPPPPRNLSVESMADDALEVLDAAGESRVHVVGHSLGGLVALVLALRAPARVRSLSLLCTFATGAVPTKPTAGLVWTGVRMMLGTRRARRRAFLSLVLTPEELARIDAEPAFLARLQDLFGHDLVGPLPVARRQLGALGRCDVSGELGRLAGVPTLVVSAERDRLAPPAAGRFLAAGIAGARYVELDGAAHAVPITAPERVNAPLLAHVGSC